MAKLVSKTYGDALFELALEENLLDEFYDAAKVILEVLKNNQEFSDFMNHPQIIKEDKIKMVEEVFEERIPGEIIGLMTLMITKGRAEELKSVFDYFVAAVKEEKKIGIADVTTAIELNAAQKERVEKRLLETTKYERFEMNYHVDESLIGGMIIRIGDRVIDSSVKTILYDLTRELRNIQV